MSAIANLLLLLAAIPPHVERPPMTIEDALEQIAATGSDEPLRGLARNKLAEIRARGKAGR